MGCASSKESVGRRNSIEDAKSPAPKHELASSEAQSARNARARRLSHIGPPTKGQGNAPQPADAAATSDKQDRIASENTRKRRLSYVPYKDGDKNKELDANVESPGSATSREVPAFVPPTEGETIIQNIGCISVAGREPGYVKTNQDKVCVLTQYLQPDQSFFSAMDGHGPFGHLVAEYVTQNVAMTLGEKLPGQFLSKALTESFKRVDETLKSSQIDCDFSGASSTVSILKGNLLTTAWVGDSRGVLGRVVDGRIVAFDLTQDHKPGNKEEKERIERSGGRVEPLVAEDGECVGPQRVWLRDSWLPGLAMSRAFGDSVAHSVGVTCKPDVSEVTLTPDDRFIILASDGVWEFIDSQEAADIVVACPDAPTACQVLTDVASQRWVEIENDVSDDISCVIVFLK